MIEKVLLIVIFSSLPSSFFTQVDDVLSDSFIENINNQNLSWVAGRNFPENEAKEFLEFGIINYTNLDASNTLDTLNHRTFYYSYIPPVFDARRKWPECKDLINSNLRYVKMCANDVWVMNDRICIETKGKTRVSLSGEDIRTCCSFCQNAIPYDTNWPPSQLRHTTPFNAWKYWVRHGVATGGDWKTDIGCKPRFTTTSGCKFKCKFECTNKKYKTGYWRDKRRGRFAYTVNKDPKQIQIEIMEHGPVLAVMNYYPELLSYKSGIFKLKKNSRRLGHHLVKIIGWSFEKKVDYWIVAGNMGDGFGKDHGFIKIPIGEYELGIEAHVTAGRSETPLSPREYLVPSTSEETQLNISLLVLNVLMAVVLM
ncbi:cathepsin B-like cysteine proteinase isoform X2 [Tenebrio molitor]|uniref:cathepsin B-like cysteine proteinase isoform X2 n=1 Tax=Tenebrio molitor TaxID=7067 RepID=UPI00362483A7